MSYAGFRFTGRFAASQRPEDRPPAVEGDTWARDKVAGVGGTEFDATFANRLKANLEGFVTRLGGDLNDGDDQLANAAGNALAGKADAEHDHDEFYYRRTEVDGLLDGLVAAVDVVDALTSTNAAAPLSAKQGKVLKDLIDGLGDVMAVADLAEAATLTGLDRGDLIHVVNNGSGKWVRYQVTAAGDGTWAGATKVVIWTQSQAPTSHSHPVADLSDASANGKSLLAMTYASMRIALGLGSAALANTGTTAGTVPVLDAGGKYPALDGSQITNLPGALAIPSQIEAEAGTDNAKAMTPLRVKQAVAAYGFPPGHLFGLTLSNNVADATNDIDVAVGAARDGADTANIRLSVAITKRLDAAWEVGTNQGGLDTGAVGNGTYHLWLIKRPDTGVVDVLFSLSATAPTMPASYTLKRRIGAVIRSAGAILPFVQSGNAFELKSYVLDVDVANLGATATSYALTVPTGISVEAEINFVCFKASSSPEVNIYSPLRTDQAADNSAARVVNVTSSAVAGQGAGRLRITTNTSGQIRAVCTLSATTLRIATSGWIDTRGRDVA